MADKQKIDIERLLQWAYRDELPKQAVGELTGWERLIYLGTNVDRGESGYEARLPVALGPPHPDALLIDYAVRGLPMVQVDWSRDRAHLMGHLLPYLGDQEHLVVAMSTDPVVRVREGCDRTGRKFAEARVTRKGWAFDRRPSFSVAAAIMMHARLGTRPIWDLGPIRLLRVPHPDQPSIHVVEGLVRGRRRYQDGANCPLRLDPPAAEIACARWEYLVWHQALESLAREMWTLRDFQVLPPSAPPAPWRSGGLRHKSKLDDALHATRKRAIRYAESSAGERVNHR